MVKSVLGEDWSLSRYDSEVFSALQECLHDDIIAHMLAIWKVSSEDAKNFLDPRLKTLCPPIGFFKDMDKAVLRLVQAVKNSERICIWGDYDVDGATSTAILGRVLRFLGVDFVFHIPNRIDEGYGPNAKGLRSYFEDGVSLVVVVDSGTKAYKAFDDVADCALDIVVLDHHQAEEVLPSCYALVNPNRLDQDSGYEYLSAAAVVFLTCCLLCKSLKEDGFSVPDMMDYVDIVGLATIADVVPLRGLNRAFVKRAYERLPQTQILGLKALCDVASVNFHMSAQSIYGMALGPRINAAGRIGNQRLGTELLLTEDYEEAQRLAKILDEENLKRRKIEASCLEEALSLVQDDLRGFVICGDWHEGVVGIVAGRLKERYRRPSFVFAKTQDGFYKGSGRSVPGFDLGSFVQKSVESGYLISGGGHAMAAGALLDISKLSEFQDFMEEEIENSEFGRVGFPCSADLVIPLKFANEHLVHTLSSLEPFGQTVPSPVLIVPNVKIETARILGSNPKTQILSLLLEHEGFYLKAIVFSANFSPLTSSILERVGSTCDVLGSLALNEFRGEVSAQFTVFDIRFP